MKGLKRFLAWATVAVMVFPASAFAARSAARRSASAALRSASAFKACVAARRSASAALRSASAFAACSAALRSASARALSAASSASRIALISRIIWSIARILFSYAAYRCTLER